MIEVDENYLLEKLQQINSRAMEISNKKARFIGKNTRELIEHIIEEIEDQYGTRFPED